MKTYKLWPALALVSLASLSVGVPACTDLDSDVFDQADANQFPTNETELLDIVGATYAELRPFLDQPFRLMEPVTDELVVPTRGPDWYDNADWQLMAKHEWTPLAPGYLNDTWEWAYRVIAKANINLVALETSTLQIQGKEALVGELKMLRALAYFWLMDLYGGVPIVTEDTPPGNPAQNTRAEVFAFVEKDIKEALPDLKDGKGGQFYARFTKGAANAFLAKLYLNAEVYTGTPRWADAISAADAVINSPVGYSLNLDYLSNFAVNNAGNPSTFNENLFVIAYDKNLATGMDLQMRTLHYAQGVVYGLSVNPWNGFATRAEFYNSFTDDDRRKAMWLAGLQRDNAGNPIRYTDAVDNVNKPLVFTPEISSLERALQNEGVRNVKYEVQRNNSNRYQDNDFAVFRLADVLLMKAEALLRTGNPGSALPLVNQVRVRAGVPGFTTLTLDNLLAERGRELAWEGWRRNDLIRFGRFEDAWQFKTNNQTFRRLFPIPARQLSNNSRLKQNTGY
jgi:starch-binding outer membrane protein, SusD/RagB family